MSTAEDQTRASIDNVDDKVKEVERGVQKETNNLKKSEMKLTSKALKLSGKALRTQLAFAFFHFQEADDVLPVRGVATSAGSIGETSEILARFAEQVLLGISPCLSRTRSSTGCYKP